MLNTIKMFLGTKSDWHLENHFAKCTIFLVETDFQDE